MDVKVIPMDDSVNHRAKLDKLYAELVWFHEKEYPVPYMLTVQINNYRWLLGMDCEDEDELMFGEDYWR